ncbi:LacI family DNA-binding transcriptional regulator [Nakamurella sp. YIM 132084]|uniref:LacI family DNA-binding transcriptional regulator n=1 Tax=Nakamurella leprariae TaxID=2803911 RepID=A0A939BVE9_9ACTN|nr:LacI family DNA-binding transcriptional regulator [Nakamurella leprariae]
MASPGRSTTPPRVRLRDVAERAGVSQTTASYVLAGRRDMGISATTEQRVRHAAREMDYRPNLMSRGLRTRGSDTIGLLSDVIASEAFAGDIVRGTLATAVLHGHQLFIGESEGSVAVERTLVHSMADRGVKGFVYASMYTRRATISKVLREHPVVLLNCVSTGRALPAVVPAEREAGRAVARVLVDHGHRRIALVGEPAPHTMAAAERLAGIDDVLAPPGAGADRSHRHHLVAGAGPRGSQPVLRGGPPTDRADLPERPDRPGRVPGRRRGEVVHPGRPLGDLLRRLGPGRMAAPRTDQRRDPPLRAGPPRGGATAGTVAVPRHRAGAHAAVRTRVGGAGPDQPNGPTSSTRSTGSPASSAAATSISAVIPQSRSPCGSSNTCRTDHACGPGRTVISAALRASAPTARSSYSAQ